MTGARPAIAVRQAVVRYGAVPVLEGVDLAVAPGTLVALIGPNGAGKSTLLHAIAGDIAVETGEIRLQGDRVSDLKPSVLATRRAVLPQQHQVGFDFTVAEVIDLGLHPRRHDLSPAEAATLVQEAIQTFQLAGLQNRPANQLSGGEQARVALARSLIQATPIVLVDEPTAALDLRHQHHTMAELRNAADCGRTVVAAVHDLNLASAYADRIIALDRGHIVADGPPEAVITAAGLTSLYRYDVDVIAHPTQLWLAALGRRHERPQSPAPRAPETQRSSL